MQDISILGLLVLLILPVILFLLKQTKGYDAKWKPLVQQKIREYDISIQDANPMVVKSTLMEADKLLDYVLQKRGYAGNTMGDRLKNAKKTYDRNTYNDLWNAHKMRNTLVHEVETSPSSVEMRKNYHVFRKCIAVLL